MGNSLYRMQIELLPVVGPLRVSSRQLYDRQYSRDPPSFSPIMAMMGTLSTGLIV